MVTFCDFEGGYYGLVVVEAWPWFNGLEVRDEGWSWLQQGAAVGSCCFCENGGSVRLLFRL